MVSIGWLVFTAVPEPEPAGGGGGGGGGAARRNVTSCGWWSVSGNVRGNKTSAPIKEQCTNTLLRLSRDLFLADHPVQEVNLRTWSAPYVAKDVATH